MFILSALFVEDVHDVIVSIAHRGRLNLLTCVLQLEPVLMFRKVDNILTCQTTSQLDITKYPHVLSIVFTICYNGALLVDRMYVVLTTHSSLVSYVALLE